MGKFFHERGGNKPQKQIEHELANGTFLIPSTVTVKEFLMEWLPKQCNKHKWAPCTYQSNLGTVQNLIIPYIGDMQMQKLKPYHLEDLYATLSKTPCGQYYEGKKQVLSGKQKQRLLSGTTIHEVHRLLRTAFQYAVEWGILIKSPVPVDSPKKSIQERAIWDADEMWAALASMEDPILHLAVHLTLVGALREGEVAGLTPEDLDFEGADGTGTFRINKCMQRVQKASLAKQARTASCRNLRISVRAAPQCWCSKRPNSIFQPNHLHDSRVERRTETLAKAFGNGRSR